MLDTVCVAAECVECAEGEGDARRSLCCDAAVVVCGLLLDDDGEVGPSTERKRAADADAFRLR